MLLNILIAILCYMTAFYVVSLFTKRNDVADIGWGLGFIFICCYLFLLNYLSPTFMLVFLLTTIWGVRLALHIYLRNKNKKEDFRYKKWREEWGKWFYVRSYLQVYILQGFFMFLISFSAIYSPAHKPTTPLNPLVYIGVLIWAIGFIFESVGDFQLSRFISNPNNSGKIMTQGLWKYTRHPNYFGEVTQWWGIFAIVFISTHNLIPIVSPLTITFLILKVSGIPMLEKKYEGNQEFENYKKQTNAFFPWFPKRTI